MKIDTDDKEVVLVQVSLEEARSMDDGVVEKITDAVDQAQGMIHMGDVDRSYVVIEIDRS